MYYTAISKEKGESIICTSLIEAGKFSGIPIGILRYHLGKRGRNYVTSLLGEVWVSDEIIKQQRPQYKDNPQFK